MKMWRLLFLVRWTLLALPCTQAAAEPLRMPGITEFLAVNEGGLQDENFDSPDWIEIHNPGDTEIRLDGYFLTDSPQKPAKWRFPDVKLAGGGYMVIFASNKDRRDPARPLHTNFQLAEEGDYLALVAPDGRTRVSEFPAGDSPTRHYPGQKSNRSYGLDVNGVTGYFYPATPGDRNGIARSGITADPTFSVQRGLQAQTEPFVLTLATATPGASIVYSIVTDGAGPGADGEGSKYTKPLKISSTCSVRATASLPGWLPSDSVTHTYVFPNTVAKSPMMSRAITVHPQYGPMIPAGLASLPSISIVTGQTSGDVEVPGSVEMIFPDGSEGFHVPCGVKEFGGTYTDWRKKSFRLYFRGEYGAAKLRYPVFAGHDRETRAVDSFDQLNLRSGSHDMMSRGIYLANRFADDTMLAMGHLAPHGRFVHLYLNGAYWGQYHLRERWGAGMLSGYFGGKKEDYEAINGNLNVGGWANTTADDAYDGDGSTWEKLKALALSPDASNYEAVKPYLNVTQFIDYMLLDIFGNSEAEFRAAGVAGPSSSGFQFFLNDADGLLGDYLVPNRPRTRFQSMVPGVFGRAEGDGPGGLFSLLFKAGNLEFRTLLADRIHRHFFNDGALTPKNNLARLQERIAEIEQSMVPELARWREQRQTYSMPDQWIAAREVITNDWLPKRTDWIMSQLRGAGFYPDLDAPVVSPFGGSVKTGSPVQLEAPRGVIYFTTTGADPRLPGGGIHPDAKPYKDGLESKILIPKGATWKYADSGPMRDNSWLLPEYNDLRWNQGAAQLGYGDGDEQTVVSSGNIPGRKHTTTYFRKRFVVGKLGAIESVELLLKRDDGAVVFLNGVEVARSNLVGPVTPLTFAQKAQDDGGVFHSFQLPANRLQKGENVVAVEVHQVSPTSSDLSFDLQLTVTFRDDSQLITVLTLDQTTHLRARAFEDGEWSALAESFFTLDGEPGVSPGQLAISEIHYHPADDSETEFIELINIADHSINLRGTAFVKGIEFAFPKTRDTLLAPKERLLLVEDQRAMDIRYGINLPIAGQYAGSLANDGETLVLVGSDGNSELLKLTYKDTKPWPEGADGKGPSLVLAAPFKKPDEPDHWQTSEASGGTPGK
ncbi:MAG: lamin tail domain-containing protein [Verrucomicrobiales bacterium]